MTAKNTSADPSTATITNQTNVGITGIKVGEEISVVEFSLNCTVCTAFVGIGWAFADLSESTVRLDNAMNRISISAEVLLAVLISAHAVMVK